jgi:RNA polymerase sigma factor (sigma-70 family)
MAFKTHEPPKPEWPLASGGRVESSYVQAGEFRVPVNSRTALRHRLDDVARRYYAPLLSFFRKRMRDPVEVQDLVQQVFLRLSQHPDVAAIRNPDAYIFQTASNALRDHLRRGRVREAFDRDATVDSVFSPERVLLGREAMVLVVSALRELPERTRDVFMLRCFEGLKHAEIARLYGISVRAVEKHSAKALAHVSQALKE